MKWSDLLSALDCLYRGLVIEGIGVNHSGTPRQFLTGASSGFLPVDSAACPAVSQSSPGPTAAAPRARASSAIWNLKLDP